MTAAKIVSDIADYIAVAEKSGIMLSVAIKNRAVVNKYPSLMECEIHRHAICCRLKSCGYLSKCICNKQRLVNSGRTEIYYGCCYAGVEEYTVPVLYEGQVFAYISASGYKGKLTKSERKRNLVIHRIGEAEAAYAELCDTVPDEKSVMSHITPLVYMVSALADASDAAVGETEDIYGKILTYLLDNFIIADCNSVAQAVNYSTSYVRSVFEKKSGMPLGKYILSLRFRYAKQLLVSTDKSISQIAACAGFSDANHFSDIFRKTFGITPGNYRKNA